MEPENHCIVREMSVQAEHRVRDPRSCLRTGSLPPKRACFSRINWPRARQTFPKQNSFSPKTSMVWEIAASCAGRRTRVMINETGASRLEHARSLAERSHEQCLVIGIRLQATVPDKEDAQSPGRSAHAITLAPAQPFRVSQANRPRASKAEPRLSRRPIRPQRP